MIDLNARKRLAEQSNQKNLIGNIFGAVSDAVELKKENKELMERTIGSFDKIGQALVMVYKKIPYVPSLPKIFQVSGKVEVTKTPPVKIENFEELSKHLQSIEKILSSVKPQRFPTNFVVDNLFELKEYFKSLEDRISGLALAISSVKPAEIKIPKQELKMPDIRIPDFPTKEITDSIESLQKSLKKLNNQEDTVDALFKIEQGINALVNRPQLTPQPVTNVSINPLRGFVHTTSATVSSLTPLPTYGVLDNRRSIMVFNNHASATLYIGGSDVTTSNGLPVLAQTYSPSIDAGINMLLYGVASTSINTRVIEISNDNIGG